MSKQQWGNGYHASVAAGSKPPNKDVGMTAANSILEWNPGSDQVRVRYMGPDFRDGTQFRMSGLAAYGHVQKVDFQQRKALVFIEAMHLIIRDKVDPMAVHRELLKLAEYRDGCSDDMPGMMVPSRRE